jgi:putative ABC transport system permease protein
MALTDWTIIRRSLFTRLFSTSITVLTVAIAVALMLVLLTMREAGRKAFDRGSGDMHLLISADASPLVSVLNGIFYANAPQRPIMWSKFEELKARFPVEYIVPTQQGDSYLGMPVLATNRDFFDKFRPNPGEPWKLVEGRFFDKEFEVVVGAAAARAGRLRVGDELFLTHGTAQSRQLGDAGGAAPHVHREFTYKVVGILAPTGGSHDRALFTDLNSAWIIHAHDRREREELTEHAAKAGADGKAAPTEAEHDEEHERRTTIADVLDSDRKVTGMYVRLATRPGSDTPANLPQVFDMLRRDPSLTVASPRDQIDKLFRIVSNIDGLFVAMAVVVMVSSGIGIMLALYNSMEQRRRQIAILRVLGCSRFRVFGLVLTESAVIGLLGAACGVALAFVGGILAAAVLKDRLGLVVDAMLSPRAVLATVTAAVALAAAAGLAPAVVAYRTSVARNLRPIG